MHKAKAQKRISFDYSKSLLATLFLTLRVEDICKDHVKSDTLDELRHELQDVAIMATILYMQVIIHVHKVPITDWDHSDLHSRLTLAICSGVAIKYLIDEPPFSSSLIVNLLVNSDELRANGFRNMLLYVHEYEAVIVSKINLYRCQLNHRMLAESFLSVLRSRQEIDANTGVRVSEIIAFFSFHVCDALPEYKNYKDNEIGEAIVVVCIDCVQSSTRSDVCITKSRVVCSSSSYMLAMAMAYSMSLKSVESTQEISGGNFTSATKWQNQATTPETFRLVVKNMRKKARLSDSSNRGNW